MLEPFPQSSEVVLLNVLFVSRKWPPAVGGMETYAQELVAALTPLCNLDLMVLPGRSNGHPPRLLALALFLFKSAWRIARARVDILHVGDLVLWPLAWIAAVTGSAGHIVITAYGLDVIYGRRRGFLPGCYRIYFSLGVRLTRKCVRIIAISSSTAQLCREAGFRDVEVVTPGVGLRDVPPAPEQSVEPFILFIGRIVKRKGAGWFAREVMPQLPSDLRMIAIGKPWDPEELAALVDNSRIEYRDYVSRDELLRLRRSAVAVIMPNIPSGGLDIEGFGLAAVEAAADGGVLVASGIEGLVDAVVDGKSGFLLPSSDPEKWAQRIADIWNWTTDERLSFINEARRTVAAEYTWSVVATRILDAYEKQT